VEGEPVHIIVDAFQWDDLNTEHLWRGDHKVTVAMAEEAKENDPLFFRNRAGRTASHVMVGITDEGEHLLIAMLEVEPRLWRPITGWRSREARAAWEKWR
jgi:hypothetical protein